MLVQEGLCILDALCLVCQDPVSCYLDLSCGECNVISLYFLCYSVNGSVCLVCCVFESVCETSEHLDAPSITFVYVCVCRKLSPHLGV